MKKNANNYKKALKKPLGTLLESGTLQDLRLAKRIEEEYRGFYWQLYSELASQRSKIHGKLFDAVNQSSQPFEFNGWQRSVKYKYGLHPLSTVGSLQFIGGRFNIGNGINSELASFPSLYVASDKDTALQEQLGQEPSDELSPSELALTNPTSIVTVSISAKLDKAFDIREIKNLTILVDLLKTFTLSKELKTKAKQLKLTSPGIIKSNKELKNTLMEPNWEMLPTRFDIPANSQIFGHIVYKAGIEGIIYDSKLSKKPCIAIFPNNFFRTESYLRLDDETPHDKVPSKIDSTNWKVTNLNFEEL